MFWDQRSEIIVMLTNFVENGQLKCHQYWPYEGESYPSQAIYGDFSVSVLSMQEGKGYTRRKMTIKYGSEARTFDHFQYTIWPDNGVPDSTVDLVEFRHTVRRAVNDTSSKAGSIIVHCSAGTCAPSCLASLFRCWTHWRLHHHGSLA
jgi:protein tyrosine phosphatase